MSQQPPYGSPDQPSPPYQGYPGYPQSPYQGYPQPPRSNGTRNALLIVGLVVLLLCGGVVGLFFWAIAKIDFGDFDSDYRGSEDDPITVEQGESFEIRGFVYDEGWRVGTDGITGLRMTNERDDEDTESATLSFSLVRDNVVLDNITCSSPTVRHGRSAVLTCNGFDVPAGPFDEIEVYDRSYIE